MLSLLYNLIFMPIEMLVEMTYSFGHRLLGNVGLSIIAVSLVIQTLVLPLYKRADAMQDEERQRQKDMEYWVKHIKKTFKGDERYMMLSTYYREQNYKSWYSIKSSASILLQIPFFTAAYRYLSNLQKLSGVSFLFIKDLSKPDASFVIGTLAINVLPILMTLINIVSGVIYTKNLKFREKAQVYGLAVVFLVLLYNSPSGLVLYWTMNNIYSLVKNVILKIITRKWNHKEQVNTHDSKSLVSYSDIGSTYGSYFWVALFMTIFLGGVILLNVVSSSATEFINTDHGPIYLVVKNVSIYTGFFVVWGSVFFALMTEKIRRLFVQVCIVASGVFLVDYMFFGRKMGVMSPLFEYDDGLSFSNTVKLVNLVVVIIVATALIVLVSKRIELICRVMPVLTISAFFTCVVLMIGVNQQVNAYNKNVVETGIDGNEAVLTLSTDAQNVVVLMMDRAISGFIPYIFNEKPEIAKAFEGFVYYPNTISFGSHTNFGAPGLFGGYEYTPESMNNRPDESLKDKHNEALLLMPALFSENGFNVTVCDPPYAGTYRDVNDLSMYEQFDNIKAYNLKGTFLSDYESVYAASYQAKQESRAFYYCVMKVLPVVIQDKLYNYGEYCTQKEVAVNRRFLESYSTLLSLKKCTNIDTTDKGSFLLFENNTTHDTTSLDIPDYNMVAGTRHKIREFAEYYDSIFDENIVLDSLAQIEHYQSNLVALRALGEWFDFLRENNCWDNTKIIIVSDHGAELGNFKNMIFSDNLDVEAYNSLLLVKDFDAESFTSSDEFMTVADVPSLAMDGIIDNPINPFTGNPVNADKKLDVQRVTTSLHFSTKTNDGNVFDTSDGNWYEVTPGDIFDEQNWKKVED